MGVEHGLFRVRFSHVSFPFFFLSFFSTLDWVIAFYPLFYAFSVSYAQAKDRKGAKEKGKKKKEKNKKENGKVNEDTSL